MRYLLVLPALFLSLQIFAQNPLGFSFDDGKQYVEMSFKDESNLIVIPILVNGEGPFNFILDTGSESGMIFDRFVIAENNLVNARTVPVYAQDGNKITDLLVANNIDIQMKGINAEQQSMLVLEENSINIENILGVQAHGVLGSELFNRFVVEIDYKNEKLRLYEPAKFKAPKGYKKLDIVVKDFRPYIQANIKQKGEKKLDLNLLIDTGASSALFLDEQRNEKINLPDKTVEHALGSSLSGIMEGKVGRIKRLKFGKNFVFKRVVTSYPDNWQVKREVGMKGREITRSGTIGSDVLSRFSVIFDYHNSVVYMKKLREYRDPFKFNTAGFTFISEGEESKQFYVSRIIPNSPADNAGILPEDEIISIEGRPIFFYSFPDINGFLRGEAGSKLSIVIKRKGELYKKDLVLKKLI
ncbi:aspartyl protease family protein [Roseivirga sp.]|uniref:aspartyl protease family protein n=1 Tax=Roseivirga sp. TaxID=1964215 RepID=UPI003B8CBB1C